MTTTETLTVEQILLGAAEHIETYGHWKRDYHADIAKPCESAACADGALRIAAEMPSYLDSDLTNFKLYQEAEAFLAEHLNRHGWPLCETDGQDDPVETIAPWNDHKEIDGPEVIRVLREVAELAR